MPEFYLDEDFFPSWTFGFLLVGGLHKNMKPQGHGELEMLGLLLPLQILALSTFCEGFIHFYTGRMTSYLKMIQDQRELNVILSELL